MVYSSDMHCSRTEFGKEILWFADIEELENLDAPIADGAAKLFVRDHGVRESTVRREQPVRSDDLREELQGNSERPQPSETQDDAEARNDFFGQYKETWSIVITLNLEFTSTCRKKKHSQFH